MVGCAGSVVAGAGAAGAVAGAGVGVGVVGLGAGVVVGLGAVVGVVVAGFGATADPAAGAVVAGVAGFVAGGIAGAAGFVAVAGGITGAAAEPVAGDAADPVAGGATSVVSFAGVPALPIGAPGSPIDGATGVGIIALEPSAEPAAEPIAEPEPAESSSAFSLASSFCFARLLSSVPNFSSASDESLDAMNARTIEVAMKIAAADAVSLRRKLEAPEPPNTVAALPPPKAAPMLPPLPDCNSTVSIRKSDTTTCRMVISVDITGS